MPAARSVVPLSGFVLCRAPIGNRRGTGAALPGTSRRSSLVSHTDGFRMPMRWSTTLASPSLIVRPFGGELTPESQSRSVVLRLGPDADGRRADVAVEAGPSGLQVSALAESRPTAARPSYPEWYYRDHLVVLLNPGHDHATRWLYAAADGGSLVREAAWTAPGEEPGDHPTRELPEPPAAEGEVRRIDNGRFWARLALPLPEGLWGNGMPLGIRIKVGFHEEVIPRPLVWPEQPAWMEDLPLSYGDLFAGEPVLAVESLDFTRPTWGGGPSHVMMRLAAMRGGPSEGFVDIATVLPGDSEQPQASVPWRTAHSGVAELNLPVVFPHRAKWASDVRLTARLRLSVRDGRGQSLWAAEYPFGFDCGIIVRERYGSRGGPLPPKPAPSAPDFIDCQRAYILARLPDYRRLTTAQGAASDFWLEDTDGGEHLNLMAGDSLDAVAAMLARRFPDWQDALAAAALWAHHPCITRHSSIWAPLAAQAAVAAIPRLGGCFCGDVARLLAALAEKVGRRLGVPFRGYTLGLRGHLSTLVQTPLGRVVLDGMLGHWYPVPDNTRLATLEEMRHNDAIVRRLWYCPRAHGHEFYFGVHDQTIRRWSDGSLHFPAAT